MVGVKIMDSLKEVLEDELWMLNPLLVTCNGFIKLLIGFSLVVLERGLRDLAFKF